MSKLKITRKRLEKILKVAVPRGLSYEKKIELIINHAHEVSKVLENNIGHEPVELTLDNYSIQNITYKNA